MQLPVFFEENLPDKAEDFELSDQTSKHISQVLRLKPGSRLIITNGKGVELTVEIIISDKKKTLVSFLNKRNLPAAPNRNAIAISLLKNENRFEWFAEKATELGIHKIYPLITGRTEKKSFRMSRIRSIMISAMIQSRQYFLPELTAPVRLENIFQQRDYDQRLIAHCVHEMERNNATAVYQKKKSVLILIGPEGDFTPEEIEMCLKENFLPVSFGQNRLRTETAAIVAAVLLTDNSVYLQ